MNVVREPELVVRDRRAWLARRWAAAVLGAVALVLALWVGWRLADHDHNRLRASLASLQTERDRLAAAVTASGARAEQLALGRQVDQRTLRAQEERVAELQRALAEMEQDLKLQRRLLGQPEGDGERLRIQNLYVTPLDAQDPASVAADSEPGSRRFRIRMLLTHVSDKSRDINGEVVIAVGGRQEKKRTTLEWSGLEGGALVAEAEPSAAGAAGAGRSGIPFQFRYFQDVTTEIELPAGFDPRRVLVTATVTGVGGKNRRQPFVVKRNFPWLDEG